jgi:spore coat protein H
MRPGECEDGVNLKERGNRGPGRSQGLLPRGRCVLRIGGLLPALFAVTGLHCAGLDITELDSGASRDVSPLAPGVGSGSEPPPIDAPREPAAMEMDPPDVPPALPHCAPRAVGGPFWLTEQESIEIELECATAVNVPGEAFVLRNLPANAEYDAEARRLTFRPTLEQAGVHDIQIAIAGSADGGHIEVQVADRFDELDNLPVDPSTYRREYGLPVVHLEVDPAISADGYTPATITYEGHRFEGAEATYRGRTSLKYPKKSFTLKFAKTDRFNDPERLPGFVRKRKVTLTTTFDDNSHLRARLAFQLWNQLPGAHVQVGAYDVVVYLNGQFHGLYTLTDHIDGNLMEDNGLYEEGNLYKARSHDANFRLTRAVAPFADKALLSEGYSKEEGTPLIGEPGAFDDIEALVGWVATSSRESFLAELDTRVVQREYEDWWLLVGFLAAFDSAGKNSYHYRDNRVGAPDGRFHLVPWDFNDSFGQSWRTARRAFTLNPEELTLKNYLFERLLAEPETRGPLLDRYLSVLENEWELGSILAHVDAWASEIHAVALRDESLWGADYASYFYLRTDLTNHEQEVAYLRQWISDRWAFVHDMYSSPTSPLPSATAGTDPGTPDTETAPDPGTAPGSPEPDAPVSTPPD